jgi:energy-coupling factor transporter ATP-binding protein EcfA2
MFLKSHGAKINGKVCQKKKEDYENSYKNAIGRTRKGKSTGYEWVKENGIATEWWNFYDGFDKDYFYFRDPTGEGVKKIENGDIVLLISTKGDEGRHFVGIMGECEKLTEPKEFSWKELNEEQIKWIKEKNPKFPKVKDKKGYKEFFISYKVKSRKDMSFCLDKPIPYNPYAEIIGDLKQPNYTTVDEKNYDKVIKMLEEAKKENSAQQEKIEKIIEKIEKIINKIKSPSKEGISTSNTPNSNKSLSSIINAIKTKPFLILAGISGTGKTQIARLIAGKWEEGIKNGMGDFIDENLILKERFFTEPPILSPERVAFLPVRPDWNEPRKMWGYYNPLTGLFYPTDGLKVLLNAFRDYVKNKDKYKAKKYFAKKYFIILDEMNLARVEYYMSDLLSLMENMWEFKEKKKEGNTSYTLIKGETAQIHPYLDACILSIPSQNKDEKRGAYVCSKLSDKDKNECKKCPYYPLLHPEDMKNWKPDENFQLEGDPIPPRIAYPANLVIIGTVNVDETTFSFAPKVLDRAFVAEFNEVHVDEYLKICSDLKSEKNVFFNFVDTLIKILQPANLHFGYRVIHEMLEYLYTAHIIKKDEKKFIISDLTQMNDKSHPHFDFLLKSKVLPKIHGGEERVEEVLRNLLAYCFSDDYADSAQKLKESKETWWRESLDEIIKHILTENEKTKSDEATASKEETSPSSREDTGNSKEFRFKESASKILEMYRRLKDTGYCSYF